MGPPPSNSSRRRRRAPLGDDALAAAATVFVTSIAVRLDDLGIPDGSDIGLEIPGAASWTLSWRASDSRWVSPPAWRTMQWRRSQSTRRPPCACSLRGPVSTENADVITTSGDGDIGTAALVRMGQLFT